VLKVSKLTFMCAQEHMLTKGEEPALVNLISL